MSSQGTLEDRIGMFKAGDTLIQSWGDYDPGKKKSDQYIEYSQAIKGT